MRYALLDEAGHEIEGGDCKGSVDKEYLKLFPKIGNVLPFHLRDIVEVEAENYRIKLSMESGEEVVLSNLGYDFEDFLRVLTNMRSEVIIKDLLVDEVVRKTDIEMDFIYCDENGFERAKGAGKARLYETGLIIIPERGDVFRIPYSDILKVSESNYEVKISTELGEQLVLKRMGSEREPFAEALSSVLSELQNKAFSLTKAMFPTVDSMTLRRIANLMREGKAVSKSYVDAIDPKIWLEMERRIASVGLRETYAFLKELSRQDKIAIGFKRGLMGEYIWYLIPIYGSKYKGYGNAVAMEASEDGGGKATYFFRMVGRRDYLEYESAEELDKVADQIIKKINRCMVDINFRREPIYLPDEKLEEQAYVKYRVAVRKVPSLKLLRSLYIGRVIHSSPEKWKKDVVDLLRFNVEASDDLAKWKK